MNVMKKRLKEIMEKIMANRDGAWRDDLTDTIECVILEDLAKGLPEDLEDDEEQEVIEYNGWFEDLEKLISEL